MKNINILFVAILIAPFIHATDVGSAKPENETKESASEEAQVREDRRKEYFCRHCNKGIILSLSPIVRLRAVLLDGVHKLVDTNHYIQDSCCVISCQILIKGKINKAAIRKLDELNKAKLPDSLQESPYFAALNKIYQRLLRNPHGCQEEMNISAHLRTLEKNEENYRLFLADSTNEKLAYELEKSIAHSAWFHRDNF
jgi:hypothetical protein